LVSNLKGRIHIESVREQGAEELDLRGRNWQEAREHCIVRSFIICAPHQVV
jgi:hypothetical protein